MNQTATARGLFDGALYALRAKDVGALLAQWADDGVFIDPHFPEPEMRGHAAIAAGHRWAFAGMRRFGFTLHRWFDGADASSGAAEVATHHVLRTGRRLEFPQVFVVDSRDGLLTSLRAYEPYGPGGAAGALLGLPRFSRRLRRAAR